MPWDDAICGDIERLVGSLGGIDAVEEYLRGQVEQLGTALVAFDNKPYFEEVQEKLRRDPPFPTDDCAIKDRLAQISVQLENTHAKIASLDARIARAKEEHLKSERLRMQRDARSAIDAVRHLLAETGVTRFDLGQLGSLVSWLAKHRDAIDPSNVI